MLDCIRRGWDENDILRRSVRRLRLISVAGVRFVPISPELLHPSMTEPSTADIPLRAEIGRKLLHLLALVIPIGIWLLGRDIALIFLTPLTAIAVAADVLRARSAGFNRFIYKVFGFMMRREELPPVGGPIVLNGATWVLISALLVTAIFPINIAALAIATFMLADAAAAVIGRIWGQVNWPRSQRTLEGSAAFFVVAFGILSAFTQLTVWQIVVVALVGTLFEVAPRILNDNVRVPLALATAMILLG